MSRTNSRARWTPVTQGDVYCSPACGGGCKRRDHDLKRTATAQLVEILDTAFPQLGPWRADVWENLGWHGRAVSRAGHYKVHTPNPLFDGPYQCFLGQPGSGGKWVADAARPAEAVEAVIRLAQKDLGDLREMMVAAGIGTVAPSVANRCRVVLLSEVKRFEEGEEHGIIVDDTKVFTRDRDEWIDDLKAGAQTLMELSMPHHAAKLRGKSS